MKQSTLESINNYMFHGVPPGGFLRAVLENNLMGALDRADLQNREDLVEICRYIYNSAPLSCHGSPKIVAAWIEMHAKRAERNA